MAEVNSTDILGVWRALPGNELQPGWRSIDLLEAGGCRVKAARCSPGNEEAILLGFPTMKIGANTLLPKGQGFRMEKAHLGEVGGGYLWLAIVRQPAGSLELFAAVASDVVSLLSSSRQLTEKQVYQKVLGRVRSWQEFMRKGREGLSTEAELGLVGELYVMREMIEQGVPLFTAADAWKGPHDGLHDYLLAGGAIEVKSTLASEGFPVRILSLDQLDDSYSQPLFLAGLRFSVGTSGSTLPQLVSEMRSTVEPDQAAASLFESALLAAGYLDMHADSYERHFLLSEMKVYPVDVEFPRLVPFNIPSAIRRAQYDLDLALVSVESQTMTDVLLHLGVV